MIALLAAILVLAGAAFMLVAAIGLVRFDDALTRMQAATKAGSLGVGCVLLAAGLGLGTADAILAALVAALFTWCTTPIAGHALGQAAYHDDDVRARARLVVDELADATRRTPPAPDAPPSGEIGRPS
jgi:monovalent cation/proton antiporter MnhG/PhaG subunit